MQETSDGHVKKRKRECSMYAAAHVKKRKRECPKINLHRPVLGGCWPAAAASNETTRNANSFTLRKHVDTIFFQISSLQSYDPYTYEAMSTSQFLSLRIATKSKSHSSRIQVFGSSILVLSLFFLNITVYCWHTHISTGIHHTWYGELVCLPPSITKLSEYV